MASIQIGSAKKSDWWSRLATIFQNKGYVVFGIDGLEDTNHIYRRNTNWNKIIENATSFINAGGRARWDFIVFKHNEHQINEARDLAEKLGFEQFRTKKTGRFFSNEKLKGKDVQPVMNRNEKIEYYIEKPNNIEYQNTSLIRENDIIQKFGSMQNYLDKTNIQCKVLDKNEIYISAEGLVFPCCWIANQLYIWYSSTNQITKLLEKCGGKSSIDAKTNRLENILNGSFFKSIEDSWTKDSCENGKLKVCSKTCGKLFDQFKEQY